MQAPPQVVYVRPPRNGLGISSFILGLLAVIYAWIPGGGILWGAIGLSLGLVQRGRLSRGEATNRSLTKAGIILSVVGMVLSLGITIALVATNSTLEL